MNTDIIITRIFDDGRPQQVMKFRPVEYWPSKIELPPTPIEAMNFAALLFCVQQQPPGSNYDAWAAVERLGLARHFVDVTPAAPPIQAPPHPDNYEVANRGTTTTEPDLYKEGDHCPYCTGRFHLPRVENCSCHISPPCDACVDNALECDQCGNMDLVKRTHEIITAQEVGSIEQSIIFEVPRIPAPDLMTPPLTAKERIAGYETPPDQHHGSPATNGEQP